MNKIPYINRLTELSEKLTQLFPDWVTGKSDVMKNKYYKKYGARDYSQLIRRNKISNMSAYLCVTAVFLVLIFWILITRSAGDSVITSLPRPGNNQAARSVPVEVQMRYRDVVLTKDITLTLRQKKLTEREKLAKLRDFKKSLGNRILGENKDLDHVTKQLNLMDRDPETGITVDWTSGDPELVSETGEVNLIRAGSGKDVGLKADMALDDAAITAVYRLKIDPEATEEDYVRSLEMELKAALDDLRGDAYTEKIILPGKLDESIEVQWSSRIEEDSAFLLPLFLLVMLVVYFKRYDRIDREVKEAESSVNRDLPEFINKLVLLLNAGLVFSSAFSKIMGDYESFYHTGKTEQRQTKFLYEEMLDIQKKVDQSNASLIRELKDFSQRCGVREMVRLTAIISDNWNKGCTLAEKLEAESGLLWIGRKKKAEEKGKLAETKLTFPLMILLLVLIMVTIAPAMLEM
jgi:hypothetical protein